MEEKSFFDQGNISVSSSRFIVDNQTYAMSGVTSIKTGRKDPSRGGPIIFVILGILIQIDGMTIGTVFTGAIMITIAIIWWKSQKTLLSVILSSSSGETKALSSSDESHINNIIEALNNSIIHRG